MTPEVSRPLVAHLERCVGLVALLVFAGLTSPAAQTQTSALPQGRGENVNPLRDGTTFLVTYDLVADDPRAVFDVSLEVSMNNVWFKTVAVSGDVGKRVMPGTGKKISWESAKDTDNQDFNNFRFRVQAVYSAAPPGGREASVRTGPPTESNFSLVGVWRGTYVGFPAQLSIQRFDASTFSGGLVVVTKPGEAATEIAVDGRLQNGALELREVSVQQRGAAPKWVIGRGSGRLNADGLHIDGSGSDGRNNYTWVFQRVSTPELDVRGKWEGEYDGDPAVLMIDSVDGPSSTGRLLGLLTVTTSKGKDATEIEVEGTVVAGSIEIREVRVRRPGAAATWNLGSGTGTVSGLQLIGSGKDGHKTYRWFFVRSERP